MLIAFLKVLLPQTNKIVNLNFKNTVQLGQNEADRKAINDIYCENEIGEKFLLRFFKSSTLVSKDKIGLGDVMMIFKNRQSQNPFKKSLAG